MIMLTYFVATINKINCLFLSSYFMIYSWFVYMSKLCGTFCVWRADRKRNDHNTNFILHFHASSLHLYIFHHILSSLSCCLRSRCIPFSTLLTNWTWSNYSFFHKPSSLQTHTRDQRIRLRWICGQRRSTGSRGGRRGNLFQIPC